MADRFTDSQMLKLVEIYRDYECLWNVTSALYKNQDARKSAYKEISKRLNITGVSAKDIPKKIKNLRSSYYQEIKRIEKSIRSGASQESVYKPKVSWFTTADGFLRKFRHKQDASSDPLIALPVVQDHNQNALPEAEDKEALPPALEAHPALFTRPAREVPDLSLISTKRKSSQPSEQLAADIAANEIKCRKELHKIQIENEQRRKENEVRKKRILELKEQLLLAKIEYFKSKKND